MDIITAQRDPRLFRPLFPDIQSWSAWSVCLKAIFGLPIVDADELALFTRCTGRMVPPTEQASEAWLICGRRSGKSRMLALMATYLATFKDWRPHLASGERAVVMVIASDRRQARVIARYITSMLTEVPLIAPMVGRIADSAGEAWSVDLDNSVTLEIHSPSYRAVRGYTVAGVACDEIAYWRDETSANPDREILEALRPAMATLPGSMLLCASSVYARRGALWETHRRYFAKDGPILVWTAPTRTMNATVPQATIDTALERDEVTARAEWLSEFRSDVESYITREAVEQCVEPGCRERAPIAGVGYTAFVDPSGGRGDAMTLAIAHREEEVVVLDCLREIRPPFDPGSVVREFAETMLSYGVRTVRGDRYGGEWPVAEFRKHGVTYRAADKPKSDLYRELLPAINARRVDLLDDAKLVAQLVGLERRVGRGGRDSIDHGPGGHDDLANALAGVSAGLVGRQPIPLIW